jgi:hypothetical protein
MQLAEHFVNVAAILTCDTPQDPWNVLKQHNLRKFVDDVL